MNLRMRPSSASSRTRNAHRAGCALEADEPPNESVVARVRSIGVAGTKELVEPVLGRGEGVRKLEAQTAQPGCSYRDEQRFRCLDAPLEIADSLPDEVFAGELSGVAH